jgi:hypothetical protein
MDTQPFGHFSVDAIEKTAELLRSMPAARFGDHFAGGDVECGKQRYRPVPQIVGRLFLDLPCCNGNSG